MSKNATSQHSTRRPDADSDRDNPSTATQDPEARPLRSLEEILAERLEQREGRGEVHNGGDGPNETGDQENPARAERGGVPDEDFPAAEEEQETDGDHGSEIRNRAGRR